MLHSAPIRKTGEKRGNCTGGNTSLENALIRKKIKIVVEEFLF